MYTLTLDHLTHVWKWFEVSYFKFRSWKRVEICCEIKIKYYLKSKLKNAYTQPKSPKTCIKNDLKFHFKFESWMIVATCCAIVAR